MNRELSSLCKQALETWATFSESYWNQSPRQPGLGWFGTGYNAWGVQTNQKYLAALGMLSQFSPSAGLSSEECLDRAIQSLRFSLASHHTGEYQCTDGTKWGRTWISSLGIERMMHTTDLLAEKHLLTDQDQDDLKRMLTDEADHQLATEIPAGLWGKSGNPRGSNRPESNMWNGAILYRAAMRVPDHPHEADWIEKAHGFFINSISIPSDAAVETVLAGKPVKDRFIDAQFFPHFALDHHGYLNVGYMVVCLSNLAMLHYGCRRYGRETPATAFHHAKDLWDVVKKFTFRDGRLCRIGGDTRQRYCYCQDYLLPALYLAADVWKDEHARDQIQGVIELMVTEQEKNSDGGFLSTRLEHLAKTNPYYYTRMESDNACVLSMILYWLDTFPLAEIPRTRSFDQAVEGGWFEPEHQGMLHRGETRIASFSWRGAEGPVGLCVPPSRSDLAEWQGNLAGAIWVLGDRDGQSVGRKSRFQSATMQTFQGGFATIGMMYEGRDVFLPEGFQAENMVEHWLAFVALPDGHTVARLEYATISERRVYIEGVEGVRLQIPNDLFNRGVREYFTSAGRREHRMHLGPPEVIDLHSSWVNVENILGVVGVWGAESWFLVRKGRRTGGYAGSICTDVLCYPGEIGLRYVDGPAVLLDTGCAILTGVDSQQTRDYQEENSAVRIPCEVPGVRVMQAMGRDGRCYLVACNFSSQAVTIRPEIHASAATELESNKEISIQGTFTLELPAGGVKVFQLSS
ncbi:MAG: hypothetical protein JXA11_03040 [Phycisphaerae bacterium]|nr:hypothetical protein [Phycisphaerae bacterium]